MRGEALFRYIRQGSAKVMGILNVTPDSFYDGGRFLRPPDAVERALAIIDEGAHIIDVGAESTRPGSEGISVETEISRLEPVLKKIRKLSDIVISLDTNKHDVAKRFLGEGLADMINDVTGLKDPDMVNVIREFDVPAVAMHMFGQPKNMQEVYEYKDVVLDIKDFFKDRIYKTGLKNIILDPGIGFGKSVENNLEIIRRFREFTTLGFPMMVGISRKSFIGKILDLDAPERLEGSLGALAVSIMNGARIVRVHDVKESLRVIKIVEAIENVPYKEIQV